MPSLEGASISISVSPENGGELSSIRVRGAELIHRSAKGWRGGAPWLFPAVGRSFHEGMGRYLLDGKAYEMPLHGFVMDRAWELARADGERIVCRLRDDAQTRRLYPFGFELSAAYSLTGRGLLAQATVKADQRNQSDMPFSLGNHITLAVPDAAACRVSSPAGEILELRPDGLLSGKKRPSPYAKARALAEDSGLRDLVLGGFPQGRACAEVELPGELRLRVSQPDSPWARFVFYSDGRSFFCPEPWLGEPNSLNTGNLARLKPGAMFGWTMELELL